MDKQVLSKLESLRDQMVETALIKQSLLHHDVLTLSQTLDEIIVKVQSERMLHYKAT